MESMYKITGKYFELMDKMSELDEESSPEEFQELYEQLHMNENDFQQKAENYGKAIRILEGQTQTVDAEIKRLQKLKERNKKKIEWLKTTVGTAVETFAGGKLTTDLFKFSLRDSFSVEVDPDVVCELPEQFRTTEVKVKPNKKELKAALQAGIEFNGVELVGKRSLQIR